LRGEDDNILSISKTNGSEAVIIGSETA